MARRGLFARLGFTALACAAAAALAGSCTTFVDLVADPEDAGAPDSGPLAPGFLSIDDAARVCSLAFRCPELARSITLSSGVPVDNLNYSLCMNWLGGPIPSSRVGFVLQSQMLACVAKSGTCTEAGGCVLQELIGPGDPRCAPIDAGADGSTVPPIQCIDNGTTVLRCAGGVPDALHCSTAYFGPGSSCLEDMQGQFWCATGTDCTGGDSCVGSLLSYCGLDLRFGINCAAIGNTCGNDPATQLLDCLTEGEKRTCENGGGVTCAGDILEVCSGTISQYNCADLGGTCVTSPGTLCVRPDDTCSPYDLEVNVCNGSSISLCMGGRPVSFDCGAIGLACLPADGSNPAQCG